MMFSVMMWTKRWLRTARKLLMEAETSAQALWRLQRNIRVSHTGFWSCPVFDYYENEIYQNYNYRCCLSSLLCQQNNDLLCFAA
jgi:hypothetical protein